MRTVDLLRELWRYRWGQVGTQIAVTEQGEGSR